MNPSPKQRPTSTFLHAPPIIPLPRWLLSGRIRTSLRGPLLWEWCLESPRPSVFPAAHALFGYGTRAYSFTAQAHPLPIPLARRHAGRASRGAVHPPDAQQPIPVCGFLEQARRPQVSGDIILAKRPLQARITLPSRRGTWRQGRGSQPSHLGIYNETTDISVVKRSTRTRRKPFRRWVFVVGLAIVRKRIRGAGCDDARLPVFISL